ncbi:MULTISPECIES: helix-turn-helix domain-containing protein [Pedobacter]|uniref:Helix-turn-helix-domain containing protein AraC type n=1 Tax=Pedobacter heparinus (strain ATCC 13125 / DSM 2366 / CIP 104194 / JCM 7457 / NBRC 12017 / NCIMB 9290 / NRRL B-14731 / HIM 762-3) TaxID=485917 RepID=C6XW65_PEDHD|nr:MULTISPECIES: AraC family transcriptional regulator [Pedobacter]ACU04144.1 helix-turn-helix- domain containing protein AraC type [Pedobacter heparinus DSM 2366]MBB5436404.1 AraC-like DNA-binding protein [Pedobacter sp. AK017]
MLLYVKNMVCDRCIMIVRQQLENFGFKVKEISLGKIAIEPEANEGQLQDIAAALGTLGFELMDKEKDQLVEQIKTQVIDLIHYSELNELQQSLSQEIADKLNKDYAYLSRQFSDAEGLTIEKYIIQQKIEKVKELLEYGELNLNEIAYKMGYSSSAHLSTQFKAITGLTPSKYKTATLNDRKSLDKVG